MKYKVFYKTRRKDTVEHYVKKPLTNHILWFDSLDDALKWCETGINNIYILCKII